MMREKWRRRCAIAWRKSRSGTESGKKGMMIGLEKPLVVVGYRLLVLLVLEKVAPPMA